MHNFDGRKLEERVPRMRCKELGGARRVGGHVSGNVLIISTDIVCPPFNAQPPWFCGSSTPSSRIFTRPASKS